MAKKFKAGDMVVLKSDRPEYRLKAGVYGRIVNDGFPGDTQPLVEFFDWTDGHHGDGYIRGVGRDGGNKLWLTQDDLELVEGLPLGTRVRYRGGRWEDRVAEGTLGTICEAHSRMPDIIWDGLTDGHSGLARDRSSNHFYVELRELEVINDFPTVLQKLFQKVFQEVFQEGDRVRLKSDLAFGLNSGALGTVYKVDGNFIDVIFDDYTNGHDGHANDDSRDHRFVVVTNLELVTEEAPKVADPKFKKGDRVRYTSDNPLGFTTGTVYRADDDGFHDVVWDNCTDGHSGSADDGSSNHWWTNEDDLELITEEAKEDTMTTDISSNPFVIEENITTRSIDKTRVFRDELGVVVAKPDYPGLELFPNGPKGQFYLMADEVVELRDYLTAYIEAKEATDATVY